MKISAKDEYGLRLLIRIAKADPEDGLSIPQLSEAEGLSPAYVAKITRMLRLAGFIQSTRGQKGGYVLAKPAEEINVNQILKAVDGALFDASFCNDHSGVQRFCNNSVNCSVRSLWRMVQLTLDRLLDDIYLADLLGTERDSINLLEKIYTEKLA
jgi:Rrf2 family protein